MATRMLNYSLLRFTSTDDQNQRTSHMSKKRFLRGFCHSHLPKAGNSPFQLPP